MMFFFFLLTAESVNLMPRSYNTNLTQFWPERPSDCFLWYLWTSGKKRFRQRCLQNEKSWILCLFSPYHHHPAETWYTDRLPALWSNTCLLASMVLAVKTPSTTCWTTCGPTCLRRRPTWSRPWWELWRGWGSPSGRAACFSIAYR